MIESPRWLANKGRLKQCAEELNKIAKINGRNIKFTEKKLQEMLPKVEVETVYGMMSLFSAWRIAKNTTVIVTCWFVVFDCLEILSFVSILMLIDRKIY